MKTQASKAQPSRFTSVSFADLVRNVVRAIPKGTTLTYGEVARNAGSPHAARAVGTIMKNNFDPTVPCHRVIKSDGSIGEYNRGGTAAKRKLLVAEGYVLKTRSQNK